MLHLAFGVGRAVVEKQPAANSYVDDFGEANVVLTPSYADQYDFSLLSSGQTPFVDPNSYNVLPGGGVSFSGKGFSPDEDIAVLKNGHILDMLRSDQSGSFKSPPYKSGYAKGLDIYVFRGNISAADFKVSIKVEDVKPWLTLDGYYKPVGSDLSVSGHFFGANEPILVSLNGSKVLRSETDSSGQFKLTDSVPAGDGRVSIKAFSMRTGRMATATLSLKK